jgi:hypothetical protein
VVNIGISLSRGVLVTINPKLRLGKHKPAGQSVEKGAERSKCVAPSGEDAVKGVEEGSRRYYIVATT